MQRPDCEIPFQARLRGMDIFPMCRAIYGVETVYPSLVKGDRLKLCCVSFAGSNPVAVSGGE